MVNFSLFCIYSGGVRLMGRKIRKNLVVGVTMARVYVAETIYIDRHRKAKLI